MREQSFVMIKPDGVRRGLIGEIVQRLERKALCLCAMKLITLERDKAARHYGEHAGEDFFPDLLDFITSGPVVAMIWAGEGAIASIRKMMGATDPCQAAPGTIRGDLALEAAFNLIHGSDSPEAAQREIGLFFTADECFDYAHSRGLHSGNGVK